MNFRTTIVLISAAVLLATGCKKDETDSPAPLPPTPVQNPLLGLFHGHVEDATQTFTIAAATGGTVTGADGITFYFPPNAFRTPTGGLVTGAVQIELVEALTVGDMLWLNKQTLGNDGGQLRPLISGGQYYVNATQGGTQLRLADNAGWVTVPAPNGGDPNMGLFAGTVDEEGIITWDPFADDAGGGQDTAYYSFPNDSLGWVNCDYFMNGGGVQTAVQVTCPAGHTEANTMVWLVFPDQNSMTGIYSSAANVFSTGSYYTLPVALNITVVALAEIDGDYFGSFTTSVVSEGMDLQIDLAPTTLAQFEIAIQGL